MVRFAMARTLCMAAGLVGGMMATACSSSSSTPEGLGATGTVSIPLQTTSNGHTYRIANSYVYIWGPTSAYLWTGQTPEQETLSTTLQTGDYSLQMYSWSLLRDNGTGGYEHVEANLLNPYNNFTIANGVTTTVVFQFRTDGVIVNIGSGHLDMKVSVEETPPACVPFGNDCGSGSWCPPAGLTGRALACRSAGVTALGQTCYGPADCGVNSTCLDLGDGPVCTQLCPVEGFGAACGSGGTCVRCRTDYGVCLAAADGGAPPSAPASVCPAPSDGGVYPDSAPRVDSGAWW